MSGRPSGAGRGPRERDPSDGGGPMGRRAFLAASGATLAGLSLPAGTLASGSIRPDPVGPAGGRDEGPAGGDAPVRSAGRLLQSVSRWPYASIPLPEFCRRAKEIGLAAIDLLHEDEWPVARDAGLVASMGYPTRRPDFITTGFNDPSYHPMLLAELEETIPRAAAAGVPNVIAMFGNRRGTSDADGIAHCIAGLSRIAPLAEEEGVTVCLELLNSEVDHADYHGDRTAFGVEVVRGVGSSRVRLLYDIYHMQIMEGDVIRTIRDNFEWIAHFHTGGVPGRGELDGRQELNYRAIATAIADLGFEGYLAHEFIPTRDPLTSLEEAVRLCDV